jgi:hypothetical protein
MKFFFFEESFVPRWGVRARIFPAMLMPGSGAEVAMTTTGGEVVLMALLMAVVILSRRF